MTTSAHAAARSDQDELPIPGMGATSPPKVAGGPAPGKRGRKKAAAPASDDGSAPYAGRVDPGMYERLNRPWPSREAADTAVVAFFEEVHALRIKHGIADVTVLAAVSVNDNGRTTGIMHSHHSGDRRNQLAMVASAFRTLREQDDEATLQMAGLAAPDVVRLSPDGAKMVDRITAAMRDRLSSGQVWTPSDTLTALMSNDALRAESHGALLDLVAQGPRSPAEEIGALRGALSEILTVAGSRIGRITQRIREIEAEHPELKVPARAQDVSPAAFDPAMAREEDRSRTRRRLLAIQDSLKEAQGRGDTDDAASARRDEQRMCLAILAHHGSEGSEARQRLIARIDHAEAIFRQIPQKDTHLMSALGAAREAVAAGLWGDATHALAEAEKALVGFGAAAWEPYPGIGAWGLVGTTAPANTEPPIEVLDLKPFDISALMALQAACYPPALHDDAAVIAKLVVESPVALGAFGPHKQLVGAVFVTKPTEGSPHELYSIEVLPEARRQGVGARLVHAALEKVTERPLMAYCTPAGRRLLGALGFVENGKEAIRGGIPLKGMELKAAESPEREYHLRTEREHGVHHLTEARVRQREAENRGDTDNALDAARAVTLWEMALKALDGDAAAARRVLRARLGAVAAVGDKAVSDPAETGYGSIGDVKAHIDACVERFQTSSAKELWVSAAAHLKSAEGAAIADLGARWEYSTEIGDVVGPAGGAAS